jgi:hypothetical protein
MLSGRSWLTWLIQYHESHLGSINTTHHLRQQLWFLFVSVDGGCHLRSTLTPSMIEDVRITPSGAMAV